MTLQQLKYVITVAETGTITEAANQLFICSSVRVVPVERENAVLQTGTSRMLLSTCEPSPMGRSKGSVTIAKSASPFFNISIACGVDWFSILIRMPG